MTDDAAPRRRSVAFWVRWLHVYASVLALAATLLFAITGFTLNHAEWFESGTPSVRMLDGKVPPALCADPVDKLAIAERLRATHTLRGAVTDFAIDDAECTVVWKGPGYSADATIDRAAGTYRVEESRRGLFAVIDDLHKGRDSGAVWSLVIDASAALLAFVSVTGLWLLLYLKKRRSPGLWIALVGAIALVAAFALGVA